MPSRYTPINQAGDGTEPLTMRYGQRYSVSIIGTWSGEVEVQRRFNGASWTKMESFTENTEKDGIAAAPMEVRAYVPTLSSGVVEVGIFSAGLMQEGAY